MICSLLSASSFRGIDEFGVTAFGDRDSSLSSCPHVGLSVESAAAAFCLLASFLFAFLLWNQEVLLFLRKVDLNCWVLPVLPLNSLPV